MKSSHIELVFQPDSPIVDIQNQFNSFYPFLKIEFVKDANHNGFKSTTTVSINRVKDFSMLAGKAKLNIDKSRTIEQVAHDCLHKLGLSMQVLRKSGNVWNRISLTDSWTLESQNNAGEFISSEMNSK